MIHTPSTTRSRQERSTTGALTLLRVIIGLVLAGLLLSACANQVAVGAVADDRALADSSLIGEGTPLVTDEVDEADEEAEASLDENSDSQASTTAGDETPTTLAELTTPLGSAEVDFNQLAADIEADAEGPRPSSISIPSLGIDKATVAPVGVEPNGDMEIPPADEVGWYRFGPRPGDAGSAVIAGHIAYNGVDGVFRYLDNLEVGTAFSIGFTDGSRLDYRVSDLQTYLKTELPSDDLFDRDGPPRLVLVTCGGSFNYDASSYESNVVAFAVPA